MKIILTPAAERDLDAIGDFIAQDDPGRAESFIDELVDRWIGLSEFHKRFPLVNRYSNSGVRRCLHGRYLIFYRVEPELIRILHILHSATDYEALFS